MALPQDPAAEPAKIPLLARAFVSVQKVLPTLLLSRGMHWLTRIRLPAFKNAFIRVFMRAFKIELDEAIIQDVTRFEHFNDFFTRALKPGARPLADGDDTLICPADGTISQFGCLRGDQILQAKGMHYSASELLGDAQRAQDFIDGEFCTIYLAPYNYHRVHMPWTGSLTQWRYDPGRLFSVNQVTAALLPGLFKRNERLTAFFETEYGPVAMVLVGALLVGGLETVWSGPVTPPHGQPANSYEPMRDIRLQAGSEMGRFNMGSTVILLMPKGRVQWANLQPTLTVRMGQSLGQLLRPR